jgi:hypothetical protein
MTAPFQFPNIRQGQTLNDPGLGGTIATGIAGVLQAMQERERLNRERDEFESKQAYFKTIDTGNKLDNEKKKGELKKEQRSLEARGMGLDAYTQWVGGGAKQDTLGAIIARIKDPDVAQDFVDRVTKHRQQENEAAIAQANQVQADVAAATQGDVIKSKKADATKSQVDADVAVATQTDVVADAKADRKKSQADAKTAMAAANAPPAIDPNTINAATNLGRTFGLPIGQAFSATGATLPAGIDPNAKGQAAGGMGAADKRRNEVATTSAMAADRVINELEKAGVSISRLTPLVQNTKLGNSVIGENEQQLIQAGRQFAQQYSLFVTGQAASDPLLREIAATVIPSAGDKAGVRQQKALMRQVILQAMQSAYGQGKPASQTLTEALENARDLGLETKHIKFLQNSSMDATNAEIKAAKDQQAAPIVAPLVPTGPADYDSLLGAYDFGRTR